MDEESHQMELNGYITLDGEVGGPLLGRLPKLTVG